MTFEIWNWIKTLSQKMCILLVNIT